MIDEIDSIFTKIRQCKKCVGESNIIIAPQPGIFRQKTNVLFVGQGPGIPKPNKIPTDKLLIENVCSNEEFHTAYIMSQKSWHFYTFINKITKFETSSIINIVRCPFKENYYPSFTAIKNCAEYLKRSIELINPAIIVCVGVLAYNSVKELNLNYKIIHSYHYLYLMRKGEKFYDKEVSRIKEEMMEDRNGLSQYL